MAKDPKIYLEHIIESIDVIEKYAKGQTLDSFLHAPKDQDAIIRRIEIIGEAVKNLAEDFKGKYPDVPWQDAADMRNILIHEYFVVDVKTVWDTVNNDLPKLKQQIQKILKKLLK